MIKKQTRAGRNRDVFFMMLVKYKKTVLTIREIKILSLSARDGKDFEILV